MTDFIKLTQITNWKIEKEKKEPTTTKAVYVRPQDIVSFSDDEGTTLVQFMDKGIHVKESAEEIFNMINAAEYHPLTWAEPFAWKEPISFRDNEKQGYWWDSDWLKSPQVTCEMISKNTPHYGYAIVWGNGEVWE